MFGENEKKKIKLFTSTNIYFTYFYKNYICYFERELVNLGALLIKIFLIFEIYIQTHTYMYGIYVYTGSP